MRRHPEGAKDDSNGSDRDDRGASDDAARRPRKGVGFRTPVLLFMLSAGALLIVVVSGAAHGML